MMTELDNIKSASSKILAGYVISYRLFHMFPERNELCMIELMNRRAKGDDFNFEEYIENEVKNSPKPTDLGLISKISGNAIK